MKKIQGAPDRPRDSPGGKVLEFRRIVKGALGCQVLPCEAMVPLGLLF
jgi:hypothetical protein